jgi:tRNA(Arg) A34 adenosine deaminase TadA
MSKSQFINEFMEEALRQAALAFEKDEIPVGAVVVENGKIISAKHNEGRLLNDASAHAEMLAVRAACEIKGSSRLDECDLYTTLEPCTMCAGLISLARIKNLYYSLDDKKFGAIESGVKFFSSKSCFHKPDVYSGISTEKSKYLLTQFFLKKRAKKTWNGINPTN